MITDKSLTLWAFATGCLGVAEVLSNLAQVGHRNLSGLLEFVGINSFRFQFLMA